MPKETLGYVRLEWTCPNCGSRNAGPEKKCAGCGAPQPENVHFEQAAEEKLITDQAEIARAASGPDVHCPYCGARNPAGQKTCPQCGGDLTDARTRSSGTILGAHRSAPAAPIPSPACGASTPGTALRCSQCGASLSQVAQPAPTVSAETKQKPFRWTVLSVVGALALFLCAAVAFFALRTTEATGEVRSVQWTRSIGIEALQPVEHQGWRSELPAGATVLNCERRVHHTQQEPATDSEKVCGTPYTVDTGSGYGEVVQDCEYRVYADWCRYTVREWREVDRAEATGSDLNPYWPSLQLASGQREGQREEVYRVTFVGNDRSYVLTTSELAQFQRYQPGSHWKLKVRGATVVSASPQ